MPLFIVQPPSGGLRSGGYAYNEAVGERIQVRHLGGLREVKRDELAQASFPSGSQILIDSLFLDEPLSAREAVALQEKDCNYHLLLHLLPFDDPTADLHAKLAARAAIESWRPLLSGIVVTGHGAAEEWCRHFPDTFQPLVAPPAIRPLPRRSPPPTGPRRLLTIGGLSPRKNQGALLAALKHAPEANWRWDLVGHLDHDDPYVPGFLEDLRLSPHSGRIHLHGSVSQECCDQLMSQAHLIVSASRFESFGIATATALASGVPTLSFRTGDIDRWCASGKGSWIFAPEDSAGFESKLIALLHPAESLPKPQKVRMPCASWDDTLDCLRPLLAES